jgi:hypothetical protein
MGFPAARSQLVSDHYRAAALPARPALAPPGDGRWIGSDWPTLGEVLEEMRQWFWELPSATPARRAGDELERHLAQGDHRTHGEREFRRVRRAQGGGAAQGAGLMGRAATSTAATRQTALNAPYP